MPFRLLSLIFISAVLVFFLRRELQRGELDEADNVFLDWLVANSAEKIVEPEITFVRLDDEEHRIFESWPLSRLDYAVILKNLERFRPGVIMVAPTLSWRIDDEVTSGALRTQLLRVPQVLLGCVLEDNPVGVSPGGETPPLEFLRTVTKIKGDLSRIPEFTGLFALPEKELIPGTYIGFTHIDLGPAPLVNALKVPLLARRDSDVVASFVIEALLIQHDRKPYDVVVLLGDSIRIDGTDIVIPIDHAGYLNVYEGMRERIPRLNTSALFDAKDTEISGIDLDEQKDPDLETLKENIVLIGEDHPGARQIPVGRGVRISRAELLALSIATIQSNRYISELPVYRQYAVWGGIVAAGLFLSRFPRGRIFTLSVALLVLYLVACLVLFQTRLIWIPPVIPVALILANALWGLILPSRPVEPAKPA